MKIEFYGAGELFSFFVIFLCFCSLNRYTFFPLILTEEQFTLIILLLHIGYFDGQKSLQFNNFWLKKFELINIFLFLWRSFTKYRRAAQQNACWAGGTRQCKHSIWCPPAINTSIMPGIIWIWCRILSHGIMDGRKSRVHSGLFYQVRNEFRSRWRKKKSHAIFSAFFPFFFAYSFSFYTNLLFYSCDLIAFCIKSSAMDQNLMRKWNKITVHLSLTQDSIFHI